MKYDQTRYKIQDTLKITTLEKKKITELFFKEYSQKYFSKNIQQGVYHALNEYSILLRIFIRHMFSNRYNAFPFISFPCSFFLRLDALLVTVTTSY